MAAKMTLRDIARGQQEIDTQKREAKMLKRAGGNAAIKVTQKVHWNKLQFWLRRGWTVEANLGGQFMGTNNGSRHIIGIDADVLRDRLSA